MPARNSARAPSGCRTRPAHDLRLVQRRQPPADQPVELRRRLGHPGGLVAEFRVGASVVFEHRKSPQGCWCVVTLAQKRAKVQPYRRAHAALQNCYGLAMATRIEHDTFGPIDVPADRLWGAQTQRSLQNFDISGERQPREIIRALVQVEALVGGGQPPARACSTSSKAARHRRRGRRGDRRPARRRVSAGGLADRLGHADQHERQRGARPTARASCWAARAAKAGWCIRTTTSTRASRPTTCFPTAMHVAAVDGDHATGCCRALARLRDTLAAQVRSVPPTS